MLNSLQVPRAAGQTVDDFAYFLRVMGMRMGAVRRLRMIVTASGAM